MIVDLKFNKEMNSAILASKKFGDIVESCVHEGHFMCAQRFLDLIERRYNDPRFTGMHNINRRYLWKRLRACREQLSNYETIH